MKISLQVNVFGWRVGGLDIKLDLGLDEIVHEVTHVPAPIAKLTKRFSRAWVRGMLA